MADKTRNREDLLKEIRATNAAMMLAFGICNYVLSMKKQHIKSFKERFDKDRASTIEAIKMAQSGAGGGTIHFLRDFRTLPVLDLPVSPLQTQVLEKLSVHGRAVLLTTAVAQAVEGLNVSIKKRNELIEGFKAPLPDDKKLALYFGIPINGQLNEEYPNTMEAIYSQTDDAIFYSSQLCNDLNRHGTQLASSFKKQFGKGAPPIHKPEFSNAVASDLMPNESDYVDWMSMFEKRKV